MYVLLFGFEILHFSIIENSIDSVLLSNITLIKPKRLKKIEKQNFTLTSDLKEILVGLILGDAHVRRRGVNRDASIQFKQDFIYKKSNSTFI